MTSATLPKITHITQLNLIKLINLKYFLILQAFKFLLFMCNVFLLMDFS